MTVYNSISLPILFSCMFEVMVRIITHTAGKGMQHDGGMDWLHTYMSILGRLREGFVH